MLPTVWPDAPLGPMTWALFFALILVNLTVDGLIIRRQPKDVPLGPRQLLGLTGLTVACALCFAGLLAAVGGPDGKDQAAAFTTVYVVEFALSIDNLFVFLLIFKSFAVEAQQARRVLTWGILGAVILRGLFILIGGGLFARFDWLFYGVGLFLCASGVRLLLPGQKDHQAHQEHAVIRLGRRLLPMASDEAVRRGQPGAFWLWEGGRLKATPLMLVLLAIEASDVVFALDSVPASFAITQRTQLVFFANMFAVMGLRCLYNLLAHAAQALRYLHVALAAILVLIGLKMLLRHVVEVSDVMFLGLVVSLLAASALASAVAGPKNS